MATIEQEIESVDRQREQLNYLKTSYSVTGLIEAVKNNEIDVETMFIPTTFKRLTFIGAKQYKTNSSDFYGNIIVETEQPRLISAISLMTIHSLMEHGYDRYQVIMMIKHICEKSFNTQSVIKAIANIIPATLQLDPVKEV